MFKLVMFSAVHGVVMQKGQPVEGAVVEREYLWGWNDQKFSDTTKTDAKGEFDFPELTATSIVARLMPHEPVVRQTIQIKHDGQTYKAWAYYRRNYDSNGELHGKPISLLCDLDATPSLKSEIEVFGICEIR